MTEGLIVCSLCGGNKRLFPIGVAHGYVPCSCIGAQPDSPSDAELAAVVRDAIEAWKTARELPYLSPSACKLLNDLIVAGLRPVLGGKR